MVGMEIGVGSVGLVMMVGLCFDLMVWVQMFDGFGGQIWGYFVNVVVLQQVLIELNIKWVWIENFNESVNQFQMVQMWNLINLLGIKWVYYIWSVLGLFMIVQGCLWDNQIVNFVVWWVDYVVVLYNIGILVEYIELMNEFDSGGQWSIGIMGMQYD